MKVDRIAAAVSLCVVGLLASSPVGAQLSLPDAPLPAPKELQGYFKQVRQADGVADDEARCKAYPDLPGNQWRPGAAQGRCSLLRKPAWSLDQIDALLSRKDGAAELEKRFAALHKAHFEDQSQREQIFRTFTVFDGSERAGKVAERWLELAPDSAYAHAAAAGHYLQVGLDARGSGSVNRTGAERIETMRTMFLKAVPMYEKALELDPKLSVACNQLAVIGRHVSEELQQHATAQCLQVDPDSYYIVYGRIMAAQPNWGGSMEQMRETVAYAAARTERNPILGAVLGEAAGFPLSPQAGADPLVAEELVKVVRMAPSGTLMNYAGGAFAEGGDHWQSFVYLSQATRFWPHNGQFRYERGWALLNLGQYEWATRDFDEALRESPNNFLYLSAMANAQMRSKGAVAARPYHLRLTKFPEFRQFVMASYCDSFMLSQTLDPQALTCTEQYVAEFPEFGPALGLRAKALYLAKDPGARAAVERFAQLSYLVSATEWEGLRDEVKQWQAALDKAPQPPADR
ncbi:tetratricopeptide repeat protein [Lysobacter sp. CA199]|uniref:tetratricopeptide repeat protein n=1 Tax=Lysobacter sp. CA199 TaxID=3455608 RepID=UPI003F8D6295